MNAPHRLFVIARPAGRLAGTLAVLGLAGCMSSNPLALGPFDPRSPVAGEVAKLSSESREFPSFTDIPPVPGDQRPVKAWGRSAAQIAAQGVQLEQQTAANTWVLTGTDSFAANARRLVGPAPDSDESTTAATEAYAREMRKRATPPPPPKR